VHVEVDSCIMSGKINFFFIEYLFFDRNGIQNYFKVRMKG